MLVAEFEFVSLLQRHASSQCEHDLTLCQVSHSYNIQGTGQGPLVAAFHVPDRTQHLLRFFFGYFEMVTWHMFA